MSRVEWLDAGHMSPQVHNGDEEMADGNTPAGEDSTDIIGLTLGGDTSLVIYGLPEEVLTGLREAVGVVRDKIAERQMLSTEPSNIADNPDSVRNFLTEGRPKVEYQSIKASIHLREVGDGFWTRVVFTTRRVANNYVTTLSMDHHKSYASGEKVRYKVGSPYLTINTTPGSLRYSEKQLRDAHADACTKLTTDHLKTVMENQ